MPRRIAVVGAGPAGLFAAQSLVAHNESTSDAAATVEVDVYDRLPTPYGLLRYGVAPDHTSIKSVALALARTFESPAVRFRGLVELGTDLHHRELLSAYDAVVYAVGASEDLHLGVPGEEAAGSRSAREFVAWYSGHPDAEPQYLDGVRSVAAIGVGNVAVDVARILTKAADDLDVTDMPLPVLQELHRADVREVWLIGRRGPQHASFTTVELRELLNTPGVRLDLDPADLAGIDEEALDRRNKANVRLLREAGTRESPDHPRCTLHLRFWRRPSMVLSTGNPARVSGLGLERTEIGPDGRLRGTGESETIDAQLVLRAIGYRSVPLAGVPFDPDRGVVPNADGRVLDLSGSVRPREYVVGWFKRGPVGVIGSNKSDAAQTVRNLLADLADHPEWQVAEGTRAEFERSLDARGVHVSDLEDWLRIERAEQNLGAANDRDRTKIETWQDLMDLVGE